MVLSSTTSLKTKEALGKMQLVRLTRPFCLDSSNKIQMVKRGWTKTKLILGKGAFVEQAKKVG